MTKQKNLQNLTELNIFNKSLLTEKCNLTNNSVSKQPQWYKNYISYVHFSISASKDLQYELNNRDPIIVPFNSNSFNSTRKVISWTQAVLYMGFFYVFFLLKKGSDIHKKAYFNLLPSVLHKLIKFCSKKECYPTNHQTRVGYNVVWIFFQDIRWSCY